MVRLAALVGAVFVACSSAGASSRSLAVPVAGKTIAFGTRYDEEGWIELFDLERGRSSAPLQGEENDPGSRLVARRPPARLCLSRLPHVRQGDLVVAS